jgi:hypothetical protein
MRKILGDRAMKAAKKQTMDKLRILREVIAEMAQERKDEFPSISYQRRKKIMSNGRKKPANKKNTQ